MANRINDITRMLTDSPDDVFPRCIPGMEYPFGELVGQCISTSHVPMPGR